jgi:hypothetical protein
MGTDPDVDSAAGIPCGVSGAWRRAGITARGFAAPDQSRFDLPKFGVGMGTAPGSLSRIRSTSP